ncbi:Helix-turn-helix domain-containing protein [Actinopolymorpha singaporensis]|uniref:Helix-turn-helix domain-containing protein n=1 Tax=Actinopolymorpha singaporensis TaxID=117157 RepID=A0A1H1L8U0_9ACTN|nr:Helix-turn-helix domain-containing protein [Actinopolymorpha singaporensis]
MVGRMSPVVKKNTSLEDVGMEMSKVLRGRRRELGLSQAQLAQAAGVHMRQIRRYEAGDQQPLFPSQ